MVQHHDSEQVGDMGGPEYQALMAEIKNVHHRLTEIKTGVDEVDDRVGDLELAQAREEGAKTALHAMRSESYKLVGVVVAIAAIAVGWLQVVGT